MKRKARVQLTASPDCQHCDGRGVVVLTEYSTFSKKIEVGVNLCKCIRAEFVGKVPKLLDKPMTVEMTSIVEESAQGLKRTEYGK